MREGGVMEVDRSGVCSLIGLVGPARRSLGFVCG